MANLVTVESFSDPLEAYVAKGRLEAEGIPTFIANENHIWANWMLSQALGGVQLQVVEDNVEAAVSILKQYMRGDFEETLSDEFDDLESASCPRCGATEYSSSTSLFAKILLVLSFGLIDIIYNIRREHNRCDECGFRWKELESS